MPIPTPSSKHDVGDHVGESHALRLRLLGRVGHEPETAAVDLAQHQVSLRVAAGNLAAGGGPLGLDAVDRPPVGDVIDLHDGPDVAGPLLYGVHHLAMFVELQYRVDGAAAQRRGEGVLVDRPLVHDLQHFVLAEQEAELSVGDERQERHADGVLATQLDELGEHGAARHLRMNRCFTSGFMAYE